MTQFDKVPDSFQTGDSPGNSQSATSGSHAGSSSSPIIDVAKGVASILGSIFCVTRSKDVARDIPAANGAAFNVALTQDKRALDKSTAAYNYCYRTRLELLEVRVASESGVKLTIRLSNPRNERLLWDIYQRDPARFRKSVQTTLEEHFGDSANVDIIGVRNGSLLIDVLLTITSATLIGLALGNPVAGLVVGAVLGTTAAVAEMAFPDELKGIVGKIKEVAKLTYDFCRILFLWFPPDTPGEEFA